MAEDESTTTTAATGKAEAEETPSESVKPEKSDMVDMPDDEDARMEVLKSFLRKVVNDDTYKRMSLKNVRGKLEERFKIDDEFWKTYRKPITKIVGERVAELTPPVDDEEEDEEMSASPSPPRGRKRKKGSDDEDDYGSPKRKSSRGRKVSSQVARKSKKRVDDEEEDDEDEDESPKRKKRKTTTRAASKPKRSPLYKKLKELAMAKKIK
jgi:hypothetical protein